MSSRMPSSKFRPPAMGAPFMPRERLIERIREALWAKLILVQAPAGFGTTTLLHHAYDFFRAAGFAALWLTLDAGDNDLDRFMVGLGQALAQLAQRLPGLDVAVRGDPLEVAQALASMPLPFMLFLDEFEQVHNPAVLRLVQQLVDLLGPQQKVLIGSREQPVLKIGQWRARQQLLEIDAEQLRFSLEETTRFLCEKRGLQLDEDDIAHLHQVTGGWAAALWLSSMALENSSDPKRFIRTFSGSNTVVASYLAEAVLSHRPKYLQDFILHTSILQKFCADSCDAVVGRSDSRELLREIERSNMFITAIDEHRTWFSYHPLFAGFLRTQLERQYPGMAPHLHRRAALWYARRKQAVHAIDHAIASEDKSLVLSLLSEHAEPLFLQGRVRLLVRWFDAMERQEIIASSKLTSVYTWSLIHTNRSEEALALLNSIGCSNDAASISRPAYLCLKAFSLVMLDRIDETASIWEDMDKIGDSVQEPVLRSMLMIGCAYYYTTVGRYRDARQLLDQAAREHPEVGHLFGVAIASYLHGMIDLMAGHLRAASARLRTLIGTEFQPRMRNSSPHLRALIGAAADAAASHYGAESGFAGLYLAEALYEADELQEARRLLELFLPPVKHAGIPDQVISCHVIHARILHAQGCANDALQTLLELEQLGMQRRLPRMIDRARLERGRIALLDGDALTAKELLTLVGSAPAWARRNPQMVAGDIETPFLAAMRWQLHNGQAACTVAPLKEHLQEAYARGRVRYALRVKVLYALALAHAGQRNPALRTLRETLQDALAQGFVRVFRDEGRLLQVLIADMIDAMKDLGSPENAALCQFAQRLVDPRTPSRASSADAAPAASAAAQAGGPAGDNELTSREMDVLVLLSQGLGNQAIAEKLFVSVTTVKTHLRNINLKLGAHTRTEAISIARRNAIIS